MANWNTIAGLFGGTGRNQILSQTLASTTETLFQVQTDSGTPTTAIIAVPYGSGVIGTSNPLDINANPAITGFNFGAFGGRPNGTNAPWFSSTSFDAARPFKLRIVGTALSVAGTSNALTINLYNGTTLGGTKIANSGSISAATAENITFEIEANLQWSSAIGSLSGYYSVLYNVAGTSHFSSPAATTVSTVAAISGLNFVASATWTAANGGTTAISEISIDQV